MVTRSPSRSFGPRKQIGSNRETHTYQIAKRLSAGTRVAMYLPSNTVEGARLTPPNNDAGYRFPIRRASRRGNKPSDPDPVWPRQLEHPVINTPAPSDVQLSLVPGKPQGLPPGKRPVAPPHPPDKFFSFSSGDAARNSFKTQSRSCDLLSRATEQMVRQRRTWAPEQTKALGPPKARISCRLKGKIAERSRGDGHRVGPSGKGPKVMARLEAPFTVPAPSSQEIGTK